MLVAMWPWRNPAAAELHLKVRGLAARLFLAVPLLWPPDAQSRLIGKDPGAGKD